MNGYGIALIVIMAIGLGIHMAKDGESYHEKYSFWRRLIATAIWGFLMYMAGAFG